MNNVPYQDFFRSLAPQTCWNRFAPQRRLLPTLPWRIRDSVRQLSHGSAVSGKDCDRTFNNQTGTIFEHYAVPLRKWFLAISTYIRFNKSLSQLDVEIDVSDKTIYRRVQCFLRELAAPRFHLNGPIRVR